MSKPTLLTLMLLSTFWAGTGQAQASPAHSHHTGPLAFAPAPEAELERIVNTTKEQLKAHQPAQALKSLDSLKPLYAKLYISEKYTREHFAAHYLQLDTIAQGTDYALRKRKEDPAFTKKYHEVRQHLITLAIKTAPNFDLPHAKQSIVYAQLGNTKQSMAAIDRAIQLNPKNYEYYYARGDLFNNMNSSKSAIANYTKAIELLEPLAQQKGSDSAEAMTLKFLRERIKLAE